MKRTTVFCSLLLLWTTSGIAFSQTYPTKPIRLVVPFLAGESIDATARLTSQHWSIALGQPYPDQKEQRW